LPRLDVNQVTEIVDRLERRPIAVAAEHCARQRHRRSTCTRCVDVCPVGAITWNDGPEIDWEACTGCGICATVCPTAALKASDPADDEMLVQIQRSVEKQGWVAFACPNARQGAAGSGACIPVNCLGRLDEGLLVSAAACGAQSVWLVDGACTDCPQAMGRETAAAVLARSNALLEAFGVRPHVAFRPDLPPVAGAPGDNGVTQGVSRRGLFKALARETARVGEVAVEAAQGSEAETVPGGGSRAQLPRALPDSRLLLLATLKRLGVPAAGVLVGDVDGPFARFELGPGCTGCQMCAFFCPTGALTRVVDGGRIGLAFRASHCTNCGLCRDICYRDAVRLSTEVDLNKVATMAVDWCFAQEMDAEPWKKGLSDQVAEQILGTLGR
jgi:ferredoxin